MLDDAAGKVQERERLRSRQEEVKELLILLAELKGWILCQRQRDSVASDVATRIMHAVTFEAAPRESALVEIHMGFMDYLELEGVKSAWIEQVISQIAVAVRAVDMMHLGDRLVELAMRDLTETLLREPIEVGQESLFAGLI